MVEEKNKFLAKCIALLEKYKLNQDDPEGFITEFFRSKGLTYSVKKENVLMQALLAYIAQARFAQDVQKILAKDVVRPCAVIGCDGHLIRRRISRNGGVECSKGGVYHYLWSAINRRTLNGCAYKED